MNNVNNLLVFINICRERERDISDSSIDIHLHCHIWINP